MGREARCNPRSFDGKCANQEKAVMDARLVRFAEFFANREDYEAYLIKAKVTPEECLYLESLLPARLTVGGTV